MSDIKNIFFQLIFNLACGFGTLSILLCKGVAARLLITGYYYSCLLMSLDIWGFLCICPFFPFLGNMFLTVSLKNCFYFPMTAQGM